MMLVFCMAKSTVIIGKSTYFLWQLFYFQLLLLLMVALPQATSAWTAKWINLDSKIGKISPPRSGHVAFELNGKVFVFGGYAEESAENRYPTNDLWTYDPSKLATWTQVESASPSQPQPRLAAAAVTARLGDKTPTGLLLGGWDSQQAGTGGVILQDLQAYTEDGDSTGDNGTWEELSVDLQQPTSRLCAVTLEEGDSTKVLVHNHRCTDHVMILELASSKLIRQPTSGQAPSARGLHACVLLPKTNKVLLFGGAAQDGSMSNEIFILDTTSWAWERVEVEDGEKDSQSHPAPRASPCLVALDENTCLLYGGASRTNEGGLHGCSDTWLLELIVKDGNGPTKAKWTLVIPDASSNSPPGRNAASLTPLTTAPAVLDNAGNNDAKYFLLSGGWYPFRTTYNDNYVLEVSKSENDSSAS